MIYPEQDLVHILAHTSDLWEEFRGKRVFLTGYTGWIGRWILQTLTWMNARLELDMHVYCLPRFEGEFPEEKFDLVIHAAFSRELGTQIFGTQKVLSFAETCWAKKFLLLSSGILDQGESYDASKIEYKVTKELEERLALCEWSFEVKLARMYTLTGPGIDLYKPYAVAKFINDAMTGPVHVQGYGDSLRGYMYMSDLMVWLFTILSKAESKVPYPIGSDVPVSIYSVAQAIAQAFGTYTLRHIDQPQRFSRYLPDLTLSKKLGLEIKVPLEQSLLKTCDWFKTNRPEGNRDNGIVRPKTSGTLAR